MTVVKHSSEMKKLPEFLYHGTECKNVESICKEGIRPGTYETCNPYTKKTLMGDSFVEDCIGNVSMATDMRDAIFFIVANRNTAEEHMRPQCILKIRTSELPQERLFFRDLLSTKMGEAKLVERRGHPSGVPPTAIEGYMERTFIKGKKGLDVKEEWKRCPTI